MKNLKLTITTLLLFALSNLFGQLNIDGLDLYLNRGILNPALNNKNDNIISGYKVKPDLGDESFIAFNKSLTERINIASGLYYDNNQEGSQNTKYINVNYKGTSKLDKTQYSFGVKLSSIGIDNSYSRYNIGVGASLGCKKFKISASIPMLFRHKSIHDFRNKNYLYNENGFWCNVDLDMILLKSEKHQLNALMSIWARENSDNIVTNDMTILNYVFNYNYDNKYNVVTYLRWQDRVGAAFDYNIYKSLYTGINYSYTYKSLNSNTRHNFGFYLKLQQ